MADENRLLPQRMREIRIARMFGRWFHNLPTPRDIAKARETLARPEVRRELARLNASVTVLEGTQ